MRSLSIGPTNYSRVEYCGATGCTMANVVVAWQSVDGGSATTAKLSVPPRLGVSACTAAPVASRHAAAIAVDVSGNLISRSSQTRFSASISPVVAADAWPYYRGAPSIGRGVRIDVEPKTRGGADGRAEALEEASGELDLGRLRSGRSARPHERAHARQGQAGHRRGQGGQDLLPVDAARLSRRQCAEPAPVSAADPPLAPGRQAQLALPRRMGQARHDRRHQRR